MERNAIHVCKSGIFRKKVIKERTIKKELLRNEINISFLYSPLFIVLHFNVFDERKEYQFSVNINEISCSLSLKILYI